MKETKLKERFEKAFGAFFENEEDCSYIEIKENYTFTEDKVANSTRSILKKILKTLLSAAVYIPSSLLLGVFGFIFTLTEIFGVPSMSPISDSINKFELIRLVLTLGVLVLFSVLGIGNIKNIKHFSIPLSITSAGAILGFLFGMITIFNPMLRHNLLFPPNDYQLFYLLPVFLVVGVLTKNWINSSDEKGSN